MLQFQNLEFYQCLQSFNAIDVIIAQMQIYQIWAFVHVRNVGDLFLLQVNHCGFVEVNFLSWFRFHEATFYEQGLAYVFVGLLLYYLLRGRLRSFRLLRFFMELSLLFEDFLMSELIILFRPRYNLLHSLLSKYLNLPILHCVGVGGHHDDNALLSIESQIDQLLSFHVGNSVPLVKPIIDQ